VIAGFALAITDLADQGQTSVTDGVAAMIAVSDSWAIAGIDQSRCNLIFSNWEGITYGWHGTNVPLPYTP
jgi:hypothetical protein